MSNDTQAKRRRTSLPVRIVEDHNDALNHIYRFIGSKLLPFSNIAMIHFDSHPDLLLPENFAADRIRDKDYVLNSVSIATWILPAVYAGHINTVAWIKPPWADQMQDGITKCKIGLHCETNRIKLSCTEPYFVSELLYAPDDEIINSSDVTLVVQSVQSNVYKPVSLKMESSKDTSSQKQVFNHLESYFASETAVNSLEIPDPAAKMSDDEPKLALSKVESSKSESYSEKESPEQLAISQFAPENTERHLETLDLSVQSDLHKVLSPGALGSSKNVSSLKELEHLELASINVENYLEILNLEERAFILDIDLDFYSTQNPFQLLLSPFQFETLHELYRWERPPKWTDSEQVKLAAKAREDQLEMLKSILIEEFESTLPRPSSKENAPCQPSSDDTKNQQDAKHNVFAERKKLVHTLVEDIRNSANPEVPRNWQFLHEIGCTFDWSGLPHHVSNNEEIKTLIQNSKQLLRGLPKPSLITMARSSYDEYCPKTSVDKIQRMALAMLEELYGPLEVVLDYEMEETDVLDGECMNASSAHSTHFNIL